MKFRYLCSGESHGKCLNAIIDGVPSNCSISIDEINKDLSRRQEGYGRGDRMKIEKDTVKVNSGIRFGKTIGSPICLEIENKDYENWKKIMSIENISTSEEDDLKKITNIRPGHADFAGALKYNQEDIRNILERSSARETAIRVAVGSVAKQILSNFNIAVSSSVISVGNCKDVSNMDTTIETIDKAKQTGVTLGGEIKLIIKGLPVGLGSHVQYDRKLDGILAQSLMSIQAIKSVEIGLGKQSAYIAGNEMHDEIFYNDGKITRKTNNAGGIEGGMSNGEDIVVTLAMKPIPTMKTPLQSINLVDKSQTMAHFERSDTCAVWACAVVAESVCACVILDQFLDKFGGDSLEELSANVDNYNKMLNMRLSK